VKLSHLLRAVGEQLDNMEANTFTIDWSFDSAYVEYHTLNGQRDAKFFAYDILRRLASRESGYRRR
jgi:hypothetical protein